MFTKSRDGGGAAFSVATAFTFSFATAMVVSRLPAGCRVDASASRPLDSASAATSAYQRHAASCPLAHFFLFASVCWLVIASGKRWRFALNYTIPMAQSNMLQDLPPRSSASPCTQKLTRTLRIRRQLHHTLLGSSAWNGNDATRRHHPANLMQNETHSLL